MKDNFEALPIEVAQSALTTNQKSLLEVFVLLDGLEKTKENGCFYASNADLMLKSGIGSHHTLTKVIRSFELNKFITRNVGSFEGRQATTYTLDMEAVLNWCESHPVGAVSKRRKSASIKSAPIMGAVMQKCPDGESAKVIELERKVNELEAINKALVEALSKCGIEAVEKAVIGAVMQKCPTDTDIEKETTNHIEPYSNTTENNDYRVYAGEATFKKVEGNDPDEIAPSNDMGETGDVCDFHKKSKGGVDTFQPDETTPDDEQTTIEYLTNLEMTLRDEQTNLNHDEVIATSNELKAILDKWGQFSHIVELTTNRIANLIHWFTFDINALAEVRDIFTPHLRDDNANPSQIAHNIADHYKELNPQDAGNAQIWTMTPSVVQTTNQSEETRQMQNKVANPVSGNADINPQNTEEPQAKQNKAAGSVSAPQMGKLSTDTDKRAQISPESPTMEMQEVECIKVELEVWGRCEYNIHDDEMAESDADNAVNNLTKLIGCIKTVAELNWCEYYITRAFEQWGWILGTRYEMYHSNITRQLTAKRKELSAA